MSVIDPAEVHARLSAHLQVDGFPLVLDMKNSCGSQLVDAVTGDSYLDLYTFFASSPLGHNPIELTEDKAFLRELTTAALTKPANCDFYTTDLVRFVETFVRVLGDPRLPHLFFVEGGALAVENALKCAFDWKSRHNEMNGRHASSLKVLHLTSAFHGRSGYTLSLTNTDPAKTDRFPMFDWPRIKSPGIIFPLAENMRAIEEAESRAIAQAEDVFRENPHSIACFIAEPIQGEGGDIHLRTEFLAAMQRLCHANDTLFVLDEVQTGVGVTGAAWAYQSLGLKPDIVAFAKKVQVGGIMAGGRIDEVSDNVFAVSGRISSTWAGGLVDMVRSRKLLEVIERDGLIARARVLGDTLLTRLEGLRQAYPHLVRNVRGRGLLCAFDLPTTSVRDEVIRRMFSTEKVILLSSGQLGVRLRPALSVKESELLKAVDSFDRVLGLLSRRGDQLGDEPPLAVSGG
jgi:L-lysine 6-transaminase